MPADTDPPCSESGCVQARLAALRSQRGSGVDPLRLRFLESLSRRLPSQPAAVQRVLEAKLQAALTGPEAHGAGAAARGPRGGQTPDPPAPGRGLAGTPLAELNRYLHDAALAQRRTATSALGEAPRADELASVRRFQQAWTRNRSEVQLAEAAARRPTNAGPLNSHALVLQSLARMQELSPAYLQRFLMHVETLQWLAASADKAVDGKARPARGQGRGPSPKRASRPR